MRLPCSLLRAGFAAAALLLALPSTAQVSSLDDDADEVEPSGEAYRSPVDGRVEGSARAGRRALSGVALAKAYDKGGPLARLGSTLRTLAETEGQAGARRTGATVQIEAIAMSRADVGALRAGLVALGFEPTAEAAGSVAGRLPVSSIRGLADLPALRMAFASHYVVHKRDGTDAYVSPVEVPGAARAAAARAPAARVGAVTGEASRALRADIARERFGVTGAGVCIGTLSDSFNNCAMLNADDDPDNDCPTTAAEDVASGDLPPGIEVLDDFDGTQSDEGRAMMQLAYDVAPGVTFKHHTAFGGNTRFSGGVIELFQAGCDVLVDDVSNSFEPFFQDGIIAQAADYVVSEGASYFSSAGNSADASYESDYRASGVPGIFEKLFIGDLHDFDPGAGVDVYQNVVLGPGQTLRFVFQYDEPSIIASDLVSEFPELIGGAVNFPTSDYDVLVVSAPSSDADVLAQSQNENGPAFAAPQEFIEYVNVGEAPQTVYVVIGKFSGQDRRLKYINFGGTRQAIEAAEYVVPGTSTTFGHSNAAGAFATGASAWFNTKPYNDFIDTIESFVGPASANGFTSYGGLSIRLDVDGNRLAAPEERMKPDAVASDADNNTFFGFDLSPFILGDQAPFPNFSGTSAAAPNASAVAALALEAAGGPDQVTPQTIYAALEGTAADLRSSPLVTTNADAAPGFDDRTGNGFVRADFALAQITGVEPVACSSDLALSFDFDGDGVVTGADIEVDGVTGPGEFPAFVFGELAAVSNDTASEFVDLSTCSFVSFNPFTERVIYATELGGVIGAREELVLAAARGDRTIPFGVLPDGPGAFALVEGSFDAGDSVRDVAGAVVAAVVYLDDLTVFGARSGGQSGARQGGTAGEWLTESLAEARGAAGVAAGPVDLTLTAVPNPVRGRLAVAFGVAEAAPVRASVFDALGREVAVLADRSFEGGRHEVALDTATMPSGVYVVRVVAGGAVQTTQVTVVR